MHFVRIDMRQLFHKQAFYGRLEVFALKNGQPLLLTITFKHLTFIESLNIYILRHLHF